MFFYLFVLLNESIHVMCIFMYICVLIYFGPLHYLTIDVMIFILYKLYILSPYTVPTPKRTHHRKLSTLLHFLNFSHGDLWLVLTIFLRGHLVLTM